MARFGKLIYADRFWRFLKWHLDLGYGPFLLALDVLIVLGLVGDLVRYHHRGYSPQAALWAVSLPTGGELLEAIVAVLFLAFVVPLYLAAFRVLGGRRPFLLEAPRWHGKRVVLLHLGLSTLIAGSFTLGRSMQSLSGYEWAGADKSFAFNPYLQPLLTSYVGEALLGTMGLLVFVGATLGARFMEEAEVPGWVGNYFWRCLLADSRGEFNPTVQKNDLNLNVAEVAPEIVYTRSYADRVTDTYQKSVPGTRGSREVVERLADECREQLQEMLVPEDQMDRWKMDFCSRLGVAAQLTLASVPHSSEIMLSPFEHSLTANVARQYATRAKCPLHAIRFDSRDYSKTWKEQVEIVVRQADDHIGRSAKSCILLLAEVCSVTGTVVPVRDIVSALRKRRPNVKWTIVVDGSFAVGNGRRVSITDHCDRYFFCADRWLLSPEPCGVVVAPLEAGGAQGVDSGRLERARAGVRSLGGLRAGLALLNRVGAATLWKRSRDARDFLARSVRRRFIQVAAPDSIDDQTLMLTLHPREHLRWRIEQAEKLQKYFESHGAYVKVMEIERGRPWVRLSFPYFVDFGRLREFRSLLDGALVPEFKHPAAKAASA